MYQDMKQNFDQGLIEVFTLRSHNLEMTDYTVSKCSWQHKSLKTGNMKTDHACTKVMVVPHQGRHQLILPMIRKKSGRFSVCC